MTNHSKIPKAKKGAWFVKVRGSYLPVSWQGWLSYIPFIGFLMLSLFVNTRAGHSVGGALLYIFPQWITAAVAMTWIAARKS